MSDAMTATTDQWMQFYHQDGQILLPNSGGSSEYATVMTTAIKPSSAENILSPKGNVSKPIRRRSRASKRTPTTLLSANPANFRALVQQFTGCPSPDTSSIGGVHHKGPITLNFQQGDAAGALMPTFGSRGFDQVGQQVDAAPHFPWQREQDRQVQAPQQQQQSGYSFEHVTHQGNNSSRPGMEVSDDGMLLDSDFSLHHLTVNNNAFPNGTSY